MDFRISQLQGFLALAEHLHYASAARALSINQPTLVFRINSLEDSLRVKLFVRVRKGLNLTEAGRGLRSYARTILEVTEKAHIGMETFRTTSPQTAPIPNLLLMPEKIRL